MASVTRGQKEYAEQMALTNFDNWNDVTGYPDKFCSYYFEIRELIKDAVDIGLKVACGLPVKLSDYGDDAKIELKDKEEAKIKKEVVEELSTRLKNIMSLHRNKETNDLKHEVKMCLDGYKKVLEKRTNKIVNSL